MPQSMLIIVSGPPSSGKTSIGRHIAQELGLPFVFKDGIKEMLFDTLGWSDKEWTEQLNLATYAILFHFIQAQLEANLSFVVESDFKPDEHTAKFKELKKKFKFKPVQVQCQASDEILLKRFVDRADSDDRHPGHMDQANLEDFKKSLKENIYERLEIGGENVVVNTDDFDTIDYPALVKAIKAELKD
jgi:adenylate kinase family enzyme